LYKHISSVYIVILYNFQHFIYKDPDDDDDDDDGDDYDAEL